MTREQILRLYLDDDKLIDEGYLREGEGNQAAWSDHLNNKMVTVIKDAIEGVVGGESQALMTRKINKYLDRNL